MYTSPSRSGRESPNGPLLDPSACAAARREISSWPGYAPTPLHSLPGLADAYGLAAILYKDEGPRFGLGSFKALGGAYAVLHVLRSEVLRRTGRDTDFARIRSGEHADVAASTTVVTATDGNHGRSVAWGAQRFGCRAKIYMHAHVSRSRVDAVLAYGADVVRVQGTYDDSVVQAARDAEQNGWFVVSDTAWEGYTELPREVMAGYTTITAEVLEQLAAEPLPTHVFVPGGVGGIAAAMCSHLRAELGEHMPHIVVVEPDRAPCLFESARRGKITPVPITEETVMAGLSCGEPSTLAWPILQAWADHFLVVPDHMVPPAMRLLAEAPHGDPAIVAGESAVAGLCGLQTAMSDSALANALGLDETSRVLIVGTEGATDPEIYRELTGRAP